MTLTGDTYTCAAGETFDSVALRLWGSEKFAAELLCVNPELATRCVFTGEEELKIPEVDISEDEIAGLPVRAPWKDE